MRHVTLAACLLLAACGDPKDAAGWAERAASRNRTDDRLAALEQVRKAPGDHRAAVPHLVKLLDRTEVPPRVRAAAALALSEMADAGDPATVKALIDGIELGKSDRETHEANRRIAEALGALRAKEAVPALEQLVASRDGYTQVAAVDALGAIGDARAVSTLAALAAADGVEPFVAGKAVVALGRIGDPKAVPVVLRALFEERRGVPLFREASAATVAMGRPMAAPLLAVLEGRDAEFAAWAASRGVPAGAVYAKAGQLLGDVGGPDAVPALLAKLAYRDADPEMQLVVRALAAESLGRLRAREAVRALSELVVNEPEPRARDRYCEALARIGDPAGLPALAAAAAAGRTWEARVGPLEAISRLGGEAQAPLVAAARTACGAACPAAQGEALDGMARRLEAARACGADVACWTGKLQDASAAVRDRAALEVGRAGGAGEAPALAAAVTRAVDGDAAVAARYHAVLGLGWVAQRAPLGAQGAALAEQIERALAAEPRGRRLTEGVNEDALRLAAALRRQ